MKDVRDRLIEDYTENYLGPVFYFCLRRTGNSHDADDLSQEIAQQVLSALSGGTVPEHFPAWVWRIARNRYSRWADRKHRHSGFLADDDPDAYETEADSPDPAEELIRQEQLSLVRRELAFIRRDYREIIISYYLENRSVRDIALMLSLSESAVKKRLERARNLLKEGMNMARTFGKLSYQPENIAFINNGLFGKNGEPWNYLSRSLCKNIMLAAYRSPSTAEELALEVGVALPYMEEELALLTEATLMRKNGDRYETAFFIVSKAAQEKICGHLKQATAELTDAVIRTLEYDVSCRNRHCPGWHEGYQPYEDMKWALLMEEADRIRWQAISPDDNHLPTPPAKLGPWGHTLRPNGGEWDILGMEIYSGEQPAFVGQHGCITTPDERDLPEIRFYQYKFQYRGIERKTPQTLRYIDGQALLAAAKGDLSGIPTAVLEGLEKDGYLEKKNGTLLPTFLVMNDAGNPELPAEEGEQLRVLRQKAAEIAARHYRFCREQILGEIPAFLKNDLYQIDHASGNIFDIRGAVLEEALRTGYISYADDDPRRMLGAVLKF